MFRRPSKKQYDDISPDEIFLDAANLSGLDRNQFEGRLERPIATRIAVWIIIGFGVVALLFSARLWFLQVHKGGAYLEQSENNRLDHIVLFAKRGEIIDRTGAVLATNSVAGDRTVFPLRHYATSTGLAHILGYVRYPQKDEAGFYFQEATQGREGVELYYDALLAGVNGNKISETNAVNETLSESVIDAPTDGQTLQLSVDARVQRTLYSFMEDLATDIGFTGGASVILDVENGEILALTSYPEYDTQAFTDGSDEAYIREQINDTRTPFLNRATAGLYTPGSIIKPFIAVGALDRGIIDPETEIYSSGELVVPNPFNPSSPTIFKDWKAHGNVDLRDALAVSSNVYFFQVGGGFESQQGIGISGIEKYARAFGIGEASGVDMPSEVDGVIPNPEWKEEHFPGDPWRVGDTYNTSIGQYGLQVTPLQMARAVAAIANDGFLVRPHVRLDSQSAPVGKVGVDASVLEIVREGMHRAVREGTAKGLDVEYVNIAAKTGTAELGSSKNNVNSWVIGFFPYERPRYAFATVMEKGPATNVIGSLFVMRQLFDWMSSNTPEYFED